MWGKYRKKPVVIEAFQLIPKNRDKIERILKSHGHLVKELWRTWDEGESEAPEFTLRIRTLEGVMEAREGYWLIKGVEGELYPCKDSIFRKTYEV